MKRNVLTKQQTAALLVTIRKELETIFTSLNHPEIEKLKGSAEIKKRIIEDLGFLLKEGFKLDPEDTKIYEIFNV